LQMPVKERSVSPPQSAPLLASPQQKDPEKADNVSGNKIQNLQAKFSQTSVTPAQPQPKLIKPETATKMPPLSSAPFSKPALPQQTTKPKFSAKPDITSPKRDMKPTAPDEGDKPVSVQERAQMFGGKPDPAATSFTLPNNSLASRMKMFEAGSSAGGGGSSSVQVRAKPGVPSNKPNISYR